MVELHGDARWNPWVMDDRAEDYEAATSVFELWTRADPGFRPLAEADLDAQQARLDKEFAERRAAEARQRLARIPYYDEQRESARLALLLALLELEAVLRHREREYEGMVDGTSYPAMAPARRSERVAELEESLASVRGDIDEFSAVVGILKRSWTNSAVALPSDGGSPCSSSGSGVNRRCAVCVA